MVWAHHCASQTHVSGAVSLMQPSDVSPVPRQRRGGPVATSWRLTHLRASLHPATRMPRHPVPPWPRLHIADNPSYRSALSELAGRTRRECTGFQVPPNAPERVRAVQMDLPQNISLMGPCPPECENTCDLFDEFCCGYNGQNCHCCPQMTDCCL